MMYRTFLVLMPLMILLAVGPGWGQSMSKEERTAVLKYGIETEVLELVKALRQEKNTDFRVLLLDAYSHASTDDLKEALILYFSELKDNGLETLAIQEISSPEKKGNSLLLNCVSYLTALKSTASIPAFSSQLSAKNKILALASIRALGTLGAQAEIPDLITLYKDAETDPNFKPDLIWAFGEMKAKEAVGVLLKEYEDNESQPFLRKSILEALGKIGDDRAWDKVQEAMTNTNTDLRAAAVATLTSYPGHGDPVPPLATALRDPQPQVREAAAQAAKSLKSDALKEILSYRVKKDPDPKVKIAALQALANYDDGPNLVLGFMEDRKTDPTVWKESLKLALDKKYPGTFDSLKKLLEVEDKERNGILATVVGNSLLSQRETFRSLFGLLLANDQVGARMSALRAVSLGKFTEYEGILKTISNKDPDAGVKGQATAILKEWNPKPSPLPTPLPAPTPVSISTLNPSPAPAP